MSQCGSKSFASKEFPDCLKQAKVSPIFKNDDPLDKENYRPVSILPLLSKVYEKLLYNGLSDYVEKIFNVILWGFRKLHSTQHAFKLLESWQKELDEKGMVARVLMDLSKAYGIDNVGLLLISDYLSRRKQRTKIGSSYSSWHDITRRVQQGSLLGPLLFNIFINDLFLFIRNSGVYKFADDNTLYSVGKNIENVTSDLKTNLVGVMEWFKINSLKANPGKLQFMVLGNKYERFFNIHINNFKIKNSNEITLLGIKIDKNLTFKKHISELCRRASYKLDTLCRIRKQSFILYYIEKAKLLANAFINSQFNYAPLIWMFPNKSSIYKILKIHKRTLQIVYDVYDESYENLLNRSDDISIHQKHLRYLAIEVCKSLTMLSPGFMWNFFERNHIPYNLRRGNLLLLLSAKSARYGVNSLAFHGSLLWNNLPPYIKESQTLEEFKNRIKNFRSVHCTCTVCR